MIEIINYISERRKEKEYDVSWFNKYIRAYIAYFISYFIYKTKIHHTTITFIGLFLAITSGILFATGNYILGIVGLLLYQFFIIFDYLDGTLARVRKISTPKRRGGWADGLADELGLLLTSLNR